MLPENNGSRKQALKAEWTNDGYPIKKYFVEDDSYFYNTNQPKKHVTTHFYMQEACEI